MLKRLREPRRAQAGSNPFGSLERSAARIARPIGLRAPKPTGARIRPDTVELPPKPPDHQKCVHRDPARRQGRQSRHDRIVRSAASTAERFSPYFAFARAGDKVTPSDCRFGHWTNPERNHTTSWRDDIEHSPGRDAVQAFPQRRRINVSGEAHAGESHDALNPRTKATMQQVHGVRNDMPFKRTRIQKST